MKISLLKFSWTVGNGLSAKDLFAEVEWQHGQKIKFNDFQRMVFSERKGDYYRGLLLTIKDQKKFCEMQKKGETLKIKVRSLAQGSDLVEFNFFVVHHKT